MADSARVKRIIRFIEQLTIPSGVGKGERFHLRPWQRSFIKAVYKERHGRRVVRRAILSMGRKNGKTMLTAALSLVHLIGPESEENGRIYSAANDNAQAALIFEYMEQLVHAEPELMVHLDVIPSTKTIRAIENGSTYRALSAEAGTKYGLNPTMVIYDELSQARDTKLYDALATSMGAREEPLFIIISTQSADPQHILSQLIDAGLRGGDPSTYCRLYTVPESNEIGTDDDLTNEKKWRLANPALGDFRELEEMRIAAREVSWLPGRESTFRNLYLNQRVHADSPLISVQQWAGCRVDRPILNKGESIYLGLDLSRTTDLTALVAVSAQNGDRVTSWFWKPKETIDRDERRDRVPYRVWVNQGFLESVPGNSIDYDWVARRIEVLSSEYRILGIAFDRADIEFFLAALDRCGIESYRERKTQEPQILARGIRMVDWGQGFYGMPPAIKALETAVLNHTLTHDGNPVLTWNMSNALVVTDEADNRKFDKKSAGFRIDGAVALAMAIGLKARDMAGLPQPSVYASRGLLVL